MDPSGSRGSTLSSGLCTVPPTTNHCERNNPSKRLQQAWIYIGIRSIRIVCVGRLCIGTLTGKPHFTSKQVLKLRLLGELRLHMRTQFVSHSPNGPFIWIEWSSDRFGRIRPKLCFITKETLYPLLLGEFLATCSVQTL
jgi:hypothetical protein